MVFGGQFSYIMLPNIFLEENFHTLCATDIMHKTCLPATYQHIAISIVLKLNNKGKNKMVNKELMKQQNKELKEELEIQEQRIAELEYKNEAHLVITHLIMETALTDVKNGMDVNDCFPLPNFDLYKCMVGEYYKEKKSPDNRTWEEITDRNPEFSDGSSTKEFLLQVYQEVFDFEVNKVGELASHHKTMFSCEKMYNEYLKWKKLKLQENNLI